MSNLLPKNKLIQKALRLTAEIKVTCPNLFKISGKATPLDPSLHNIKAHTLDFAKCFETLKEKMKYQGNLNLA
jgi:hypothetical protein